MHALPIGTPWVVAVTLLRVKTRALKYFPWERAKIDVDVCKIYGVML
jgi:hypothetical protein